MAIVPVYAALLTFLLVLLSARVIMGRRAGRIAIGSGGDKALERAMRVQANFVEYAPLALLILAFAEMRGASAWLVHALCLALSIGRLSHAYGVSQAREDFRFRIAGMMLTFATLVGGALTLLVQALR